MVRPVSVRVSASTAERGARSRRVGGCWRCQAVAVEAVIAQAAHGAVARSAQGLRADRCTVTTRPVTAKTPAREKTRGRRYQLIAVNAATGQVAWLDARHRSHVHVEADVKQAKAIGMNRWPSRHWNVNVAWIAVVASLLAAFRHLALPDTDLRKASIQTLRFRLLEIPGRITHGQGKTWLHLPAAWPWAPILTTAWQTIKNLPVPT